jgi:hypothetical protein
VKRAVHHSAVWLIAPFWLIFVSAVVARVGVLMHENHLFATRAVHVEGTVLRKFGQALHGGGPGNTVAVVIYTYRAGNLVGRCLSAVDIATYLRVKTGGPIPIMYLPGQPMNNRIDFPWESASADWAPLDDFAVAMLVFFPGLAAVTYFGRRNRIHARLVARGSHVWGEVTALRTSHHRCATRAYLNVRFTTGTGREIEGRTTAVPERSHWQEGDPIQIYFDPGKPEHFAVDLQHPLDALDDDPAPPPYFRTIWA